MDRQSLLVNEMEVGEIKSSDNGIILFEPYRGPGHHELATCMKEEGFCNAVLLKNGNKLNIKIIDYSNYGTLKYTET